MICILTNRSNIFTNIFYPHTVVGIRIIVIKNATKENVLGFIPKKSFCISEYFLSVFLYYNSFYKMLFYKIRAISISNNKA